MDLSDGVVLQEPARVDHLHGVSVLHRLALTQTQILDHRGIQGGLTVHFGQTHLRPRKEVNVRTPAYLKVGPDPRVFTSLQKSREALSDSNIRDQFCLCSS